MLRGSGFNWDLRKIYPFTSIYNQLNFKIPIGHVGDCFDRFLVRVEEIKQSIKILEYCINISRYVLMNFIQTLNYYFLLGLQ